MTVVGLCWMASVALAFVPALGWNRWHGACSIPHVWADAYVLVATSLLFGSSAFHMLAFALMLVLSYTSANNKHT